MFDDAKRQELLGLIPRGTFKLVVGKDVCHNPNVVSARFVLAIKNSYTDQEILKARFVLGGHRDSEKHNQLHKATTLKQQSIRTMLALSSRMGFSLASIDIKPAYLQASCGLKRDVLIKPKQMALAPNELLQVVKPLYGLTDAGKY